jgi:hypothetical protein
MATMTLIFSIPRASWSWCELATAQARMIPPTSGA